VAPGVPATSVALSGISPARMSRMQMRKPRLRGRSLPYNWRSSPAAFLRRGTARGVADSARADGLARFLSTYRPFPASNPMKTKSCRFASHAGGHRFESCRAHQGCSNTYGQVPRSNNHQNGLPSVTPNAAFPRAVCRGRQPMSSGAIQSRLRASALEVLGRGRNDRLRAPTRFGPASLGCAERTASGCSQPRPTFHPLKPATRDRNEARPWRRRPRTCPRLCATLLI